MARRTERKNARTFFLIVAALLILAIVAGAVWYFFIYKKENGEPAEDTQNSGTQSSGSQSGEEIVSGDLAIYFPELGNGNAGDCILLKTGDTEVLIDAGSTKGSAATLVPFIQKYCTDGVLEYVIATHAHEDHISAFVGTKSAPGIFASFKCGTIIDYVLKNTTSQISKDYEAARDNEVSAEGAVHYTALQCWNNEGGAQRSYEISEGITMNILYQKFYENRSSDENNYSVCTLFTQGENHFLFTGDLEEAGEKSLVENNELPHVKLFKAGHHGSPTSSNDILLEKITPEIVCVCCCAGSYEYSKEENNTFPSQAFIDRIAKYTKNVYVTTCATGIDKENKKTSGYTSMNGDITVISNGEGVTVHGSKNDTVLKDTEWFRSNRTWPAGGVE